MSVPGPLLSVCLNIIKWFCCVLIIFSNRDIKVLTNGSQVTRVKTVSSEQSLTRNRPVLGFTSQWFLSSPAPASSVCCYDDNVCAPRLPFVLQSVCWTLTDKLLQYSNNAIFSFLDSYKIVTAKDDQNVRTSTTWFINFYIYFSKCALV